jgi:hypothetical protein
MTARGFLIIRYSAPRQPAGAYDEFVRAVHKAHAEDWWPAMMAAGATSYRSLGDMLHGSPRGLVIYEFPSAEQSLAWMTSQAGRTVTRQFARLGALEVEVAAYSLLSEK